jgi:ABC-2 type transport system permease protein
VVDSVRYATAGPVRIRAAGSTALAIRASATYEFRMQIRRRSVWLVLGLLGALMIYILTDARADLGDTAAGRAESWAMLLQVFIPAAFGVLLADRFPRDRKLRVDELLETSPAPYPARLLGKYLGATAASLVPITITYLVGLAYLVSKGSDAPGVLSGAVPAFLLITLPGLFFVAAYSVCCPLIMPVPVYQYLFVGYWFWGNVLPPQVIPTLSQTWLAPVGYMAGRGFFHAFESTASGLPNATAADGVVSVVLLLTLTAAALVAGSIVLRFERNRR